MNILYFTFEIDPRAIWLPVISMFLIVLFFGMAYWTFFKKCPPETVFVRFGAGSARVAYSGLMVFPLLHRLESISLAQHQLIFVVENVESGRKIQAEFTVMPGPKDQSLIEIAQKIGGKASSDAEKLKAMFEPVVEKEIQEMLQHENRLDLENSEMQLIIQLSEKLFGYSIQKIQLLETEISKIHPH